METLLSYHNAGEGMMNEGEISAIRIQRYSFYFRAVGHVNKRLYWKMHEVAREKVNGANYMGKKREREVKSIPLGKPAQISEIYKSCIPF